MLNPDLPSTHFFVDNIITSELISRFDEFVLRGDQKPDHKGKTYSGQRVSIGLELASGELADFNTLVLEIENLSSGSVLVGINLEHTPKSTNASIRQSSFTGGREILQESQFKKLVFPAESFGFYGEYIDWACACRLEIFACRDRDQITSDPIAIRVFSLWGQICHRPRGPRLQSSGLSEVLSGDIKGLTEFKNGKCASPLLFDRIQDSISTKPFTITDHGVLVPPPHPYPADDVQTVLGGIIMGQRVSGKINWLLNPLAAHEWTHFLNRHHFMRKLALEAATTGCPRCVSFLEMTLQDWIESNPAPLDSNGGAGPTWETLTVAWRLREWIWIIGLTWQHHLLSDNVKILMLRSIWEHARSLMDHQGHPNNWIIVESAALAVTGLLFHHFCEARNWLKTGIERLSIQIKKQFYPDGSHFEISPLYHSICLNALHEVRATAECCGVDLPESFHPELNKMAKFLVSLKRPDGTWPSINDSGSATSDYSDHISGVMRVFENDRVEGWSTFPQKTANHSKVAHFPDSGIAIIRSGKAPSENCLIFRAGPPGAAHVHGDNLSVDVCFNGRLGLIDPGITEYAPGPISDYYRSAASHNVVLVDNIAPERASLPFQDRVALDHESLIVEKTEDLIIALGKNRQVNFAQITNFHLSRTVIFVKGLFWIIGDFISGHGRHKISTIWKCFPSDVCLSGKSLTASISNSEGLNFQIVPIVFRQEMSCQVVRGSILPPRGWASINGQDVPAPSIEYVLHSELPETIYWGLFPTDDSGEFPNRVNLKPNPDSSVTISVEYNSHAVHKLKIGCLERTLWSPKQTRLAEEIWLEA